MRDFRPVRVYTAWECRYYIGILELEPALDSRRRLDICFDFSPVHLAYIYYMYSNSADCGVLRYQSDKPKI